MKKQLLMAGLISGAVAFGVGCKTDSAQRPSPDTQQSVPAPVDDMGTGGAGQDTPQSAPIPDDGIREREPDVHNTPIDEPGTGGSGMVPNQGVNDGIDRPDVIGDDNVNDPLNKAPPVDSSMDMDNSMTEDSAAPQR